jgi:hypothetical protein
MAAAVAVAVTWSVIAIDAAARTADAPDDSIVLLRRSLAVPSNARPWLIAIGVASVVLAWTLVIRGMSRRRAANASTTPVSEGHPSSGSERPVFAIDPGTLTASRVAEMQLRIEELQDRLRTVLAERATLRTEVRRLVLELEEAESEERPRSHLGGVSDHDPRDAPTVEGGEDAEVIVLEDVSGSSARGLLSRAGSGEAAGHGETDESS